MAEIKTDRRPTRDYPSLSKSPWTLWELMFVRRSCRKYLPGDIGPEPAAELEELVSLALAARGAEPGGLIAVTDPSVGARLRKRSYKGFANKINLWLSRAPVNGFLAIAVPEEDLRGGRPTELPLASMAAEDCVLWLTGRGLGTCWLGGVNSDEVKAVLGLDKSMNVPAVICFGVPRVSPGRLSFDGFMQNTLSRRRKPIRSIAFNETMEENYQPGDLSAGEFRAAEDQDIDGLLRSLAGGRGGGGGGGVPLELALEACLEAARIAPSGSNSQAWYFTVVKDADRLADLSRACGVTSDWSAAIVAAGQPSGWASGILDKPFWMLDVPIAMSHMSLMAASMDCAAEVLTDGIDEKAINGIVRLKPDIRTVGVLGISC